MGCFLKQKGMTLIEVMVAALIIALVMLGSMLIAGQTHRSSSAITAKTHAQWVANNLASEIRIGLHGEPTATGGLHGQYSHANKEWFWEATPIIIEEIIHLTIHVKDKQGGHTIATSHVSTWGEK